MRLIPALIILLLLNIALNSAIADVNIFPFERAQDETRFKHLITELRCPKCQNQNIADSDAPLAQDLKKYVYDMVSEGRADSEIVGFMVERYGDFVTYNPPVKPLTWFLWFGPAAILMLTLSFMLFRPKSAVTANVIPLTSDEQSRLNTLLANKEEKQ